MSHYDLMNQVLIRQAIEADILSICQLQQNWFQEDNVYGFIPDNHDQVKAVLGTYCWVAEINGDVIGFISGSICLSEGTAVIPAGKNYIEIDNIYVSVQFRRQGIGSRLVDQLLTQAKQQSVTYALLYSATKDIHAVLRFYEQHNFQSWYVQMFREL